MRKLITTFVLLAQLFLCSSVSAQVWGDVNGNGILDAGDIEAIRAGRDLPFDPVLDVNDNGRVDKLDATHWMFITKIREGDANVDGVFNSADLVQVMAAGEYLDDIPGNSTWSEGDWQWNSEFETSDILAAFQRGGYQTGAVPVPEPSSWLGLLLLLFTRRLVR